jgi:DNA-binding NtrC family response regulator
MREGPFIDGDHLALQVTQVTEDVRPSNSTNIGLLERQAIEQVIREVGGNKARAARQLGISRTQLYTRLRKYGLQSR